MQFYVKTEKGPVNYLITITPTQAGSGCGKTCSDDTLQDKHNEAGPKMPTILQTTFGN